MIKLSILTELIESEAIRGDSIEMNSKNIKLLSIPATIAGLPVMENERLIDAVYVICADGKRMTRGLVYANQRG